MLKTADLQILKEESTILKSLYHRNKNQHRRARWWKYLDILKREIVRIIDFSMKGDGEALEARMGTLRGVVGRSYVEFTIVVADPQFCALGLVLVGVLARVARVVGLPSGEEGVGKVVKKITMEEKGGVDLGEVVRRGDVGGGRVEELLMVKKEGVDGAGRGVDSKSVSSADPVHQPTKKKRKKTNAIDDLFGDL